jgi:LysR family transcriptional regulator, glycine cleavage system transcriptional activator
MARRLPPLNAVRAFEAAARHLSFTRAASELNVTQAAVSHQIKALEQWLEMPLFHRTPRALKLTEAGSDYLAGVRGAFDTLAEATERLTRSTSPRTLTVSCLPSFASKWLLPRLDRYQSAHPDLDVRLETSIHLTDFTRQDVDLAVRMGLGLWPGLSVELLMTEVLFPVCSPALLGGPSPLRCPADLVHHTLIHDDFTVGWENWCRAAGISAIDVRRGPRFTDSALMVQAAIAGRGVCLARDALVRDDLAAGRLVRPFAAEVPGVEAYYVVAPSQNLHRPKVRAFRDWLFAEVERDREDPSALPERHG